MTKRDIINAWARIREIDSTIPDDVLDFMKDAAIKELDNLDSFCPMCENPYPHISKLGFGSCEECGHQWEVK